MDTEKLFAYTKVGIVVIALALSAAAYFINGEIPDLFANVTWAGVAFFVGGAVESAVQARLK